MNQNPPDAQPPAWAKKASCKYAFEFAKWLKAGGKGEAPDPARIFAEAAETDAAWHCNRHDELHTKYIIFQAEVVEVLGEMFELLWPDKPIRPGSELPHTDGPTEGQLHLKSKTLLTKLKADT